jgi:hypothetical protein
MQKPALSNLAPRKAARSSASACFFDGVEERDRDLLLFSPTSSGTDFLDGAVGDRDALLLLFSPKSSDTDFFGDAVGDREALFSLLFSLFHTFAFAGPTCLHMMTVL